MAPARLAVFLWQRKEAKWLATGKGGKRLCLWCRAATIIGCVKTCRAFALVMGQATVWQVTVMVQQRKSHIVVSSVVTRQKGKRSIEKPVSMTHHDKVKLHLRRRRRGIFECAWHILCEPGDEPCLPPLHTSLHSDILVEIKLNVKHLRPSPHNEFEPPRRDTPHAEHAIANRKLNSRTAKMAQRQATSSDAVNCNSLESCPIRPRIRGLMHRSDATAKRAWMEIGATHVPSAILEVRAMADGGNAWPSPCLSGVSGGEARPFTLTCSRRPQPTLVPSWGHGAGVELHTMFNTSDWDGAGVCLASSHSYECHIKRAHVTLVLRLL